MVMHKVEKEVEQILEKNRISFVKQCRKNTLNWLGRFSLDFYLPQHNIAIECQGIQHFEAREMFGGEKEFIKRAYLDKLKHDKCISNNVKLIYFTTLKKYFIFLGEVIYKTDDSIINLLKNERKLL